MALRALDKPGNLPHEVTSFVGRHDLVATARARLAAARLVTLTGIGGVGKTRLAMRVGAQAARGFPGGVWLVELDQVHDEALVPQAVAESLRLREPQGASTGTLTEYLAARLADPKLLLILDNCEHVIAAAAKLVETLLRGSTGLRVLATSREPLAIAGEALLAVPSMAVPSMPVPSGMTSDSGPGIPVGELSGYEAVALFAARARSAVPSFDLTQQNVGAVVDICTRVDGLPLAIELAAARCRALSVDQISTRLHDRFALLTHGPRNVPTRQQTLRASIAWSFDLCSLPERQLWARLSVFSGGFQLDAVENVCAGADLADEDVFELTAALVAKSVVIGEETGTAMRYRLLESIRSYGAEQLHAGGEESKILRRHRDWYERLVLQAWADWIGPRQVEWVRRLDREQPNIRAALEFSLTEPNPGGTALRVTAALHSYWQVRGLVSQGRYWLKRALAQSTEPSLERLTATFTATVLAALQGDLAAAADLAQQAEGIAARIGTPWSHAVATLATGGVATYGGDPARAAVMLPSCLEVFEAEGDLYWTVMTLTGLATVSGLAGDTRSAETSFRSLLTITQAAGEVRLQSLAAWALGVGLWKDGRIDAAARQVKDSLRLRSSLDDTLGSALCLDVLAWIAADRGRPRRAAILLGVVSALGRTMGSPAATYSELLGYHERCERQVRDALGRSASRAAIARGADLSAADAMAYALDDDREDPDDLGAPAEPGTADPAAASGPRAEPAVALTRRELQVGELIAAGLSNKEIAARLVLSPRTVEGHVQNVLHKLELSNRAQVAAWLARR
jgi:predicted ATPase/DNA-binding CsgD family transcriptional regulator